MKRIGRVPALVVSAAAALALGVLSRVPSHMAPTGEGVLRLSWRLRGERVEECRRLSPEELEALPIHMRRPEVCEGRVAPYHLQVSIDGAVAEDTVVTAAGARQDRPIYVFREIPLAAGEHAVAITFSRVGAGGAEEGVQPEGSRASAPPARLALDTVVDVRAGRYVLITLDAVRGELVFKSESELGS